MPIQNFIVSLRLHWKLEWDEERFFVSKEVILTSINPSFLFPLPRPIHLDLSHLSGDVLTSLRGQLRASQSVSGGAIPLYERSLFTYSLRGLSGAFLRLCRRLNIDNLHFHDLRHEATSRLFEKGLNPVEVATITGHKDTKMLMRYTHLRAEDLVERLG